MTQSEPANSLPQSEPDKQKRRLKFWIGIAISAVFAYFAFRDVSFERIAESAREANWWILLSAIFLVQPITFAVGASRSWIILRAQGDLPYREALRSFFAMFSANNLLPLRVGELVRMDYLSRVTALPYSRVAAGIVAERVFDLAVIAAIFVAVIPLLAVKPEGASSLVAVIGMLSLGLLGVISLALMPDAHKRLLRFASSKLPKKIGPLLLDQGIKFVDGLAPLRQPGRLFAVLASTVAYWILSLVAFQFWLWAFGVQLPFYAPVIMLGFIALGMSVPSSPGAVGTFHFAMKAALVFMGVGDDLAASIALVGHGIATYPWTILPLPFIMPVLTRERQTQEAPALATAQDTSAPEPTK